MHEAKLAQNNAAMILSADTDGLRSTKLSHRVANLLRAQIYSGRLAPGSKLPGENQLSAIYGVSRPTVREALRIIEAEALIELGRGMRTGAIVREPNAVKITEYATFLLAAEELTLSDLHAARSFFEPEIIRRLSAPQLQAVMPALRGLAGEIKAAFAAGAQADVITGTKNFHSLLAAATPNRIVKLIVGIFQNISDDTYAEALLKHPASADEYLVKNLRKSASAYGKLCNLLDNGEMQEAARFWQTYMERSQEYLDKTRLGRRRVALLSGLATGGGTATQPEHLR